LQTEKEMTWNEFRRKAVQKGWVFIRHGSRHDVYKKEGYEGLLLIERHWQEEMKPNIQKKLLKQIED